MTEDPVRLGIVGCGGMGRRHLAGLAELARGGARAVNLVAACDRNERNANDLADEAQSLLGTRTAVFTDLATMVRETDGLEAASQSYRVLARAFDDAGIARKSGARSA